MYLTLVNTLHCSFFTFALICGILLQAYLPSLYAAPTILIILYLATIAIYILHSYLQDTYITTRAAITFSLILVGGFAYRHQQTSHATFYNSIIDDPFDMIGTVTHSMPIHQGHIKQRLTIQVNAIKKTNQNNWQQINKSIHLQTAQIMDAQVGDLVEITNLVCKPSKKNSFDTYLIKEKIAASVFSQAPEWKLVHRPMFSPRRFIHNTSSNLTKTLQKKLPKETFSLFTSLFLGDTSTCKKQLEHTRDQFRAWGIMHFLARSGLHLIIFIAVWQSLLCLIPLPFLLKQLIMLLLSLIYFALSWSSISFMRALYTFILYKICTLHKRPFHLVYLLSLVCFFVLLDNPMQLFFLDFQLSFTLTFALAWFNQISSRKNN